MRAGGDDKAAARSKRHTKSRHHRSARQHSPQNLTPPPPPPPPPPPKKLPAPKTPSRLASLPHLGLAARDLRQLCEAVERVQVAKLRDLDRHRKLGAAEAADHLGVVDDAHKERARHLDHLFAQQRAAAALDDVEVGVDLVGAVDRDVELGLRVERRERDAELLGLLVRAHARRHGDDVLERAALEQRADAVDRKRGGRARAEADDLFDIV